MLHKLETLGLQTRKAPTEVVKTIPQAFEGYREALITAAISAEKRAVHWNRKNPTHVGCSLLAFGSNLDLSQPAIYTGANSKLEKGMKAYPERKCAEMLALESILGLKDEERTKQEAYDEIEKGDLGFIAAVVTVSESLNTGEADTVDHDVLYPCKQCQTNYEFLLSKGIVSEETVILNLRIKDNKPVKGEPITLGNLLQQFKIEKEARDARTIEELGQVKGEALSACLESVKKINVDIDAQILAVKFPARRESILQEFQRERVQRILEPIELFTNTLTNALQSAAEEGVAKERIIESLNINRSEIYPLGVAEQTFNSFELDSILHILLEPVLAILPNPTILKERKFVSGKI